MLLTELSDLMIELYSASTPNGFKISIALEEMEIPYKVITVDFESDDHRSPAFLAINPNGRIPAIVDRTNNDLAVFESGAILIYLAEKSGKFLPTVDASTERSRVLQWLMFQMANLGPMMGQAATFIRYFDEKVTAAIDRYQNESNRIFGVLDEHLSRNKYLAGAYSIADMATYPWLFFAEWCGVPYDGYQNLNKYVERIKNRPAVERGMNIPSNVSPEDRLRRARSITTK